MIKSAQFRNFKALRAVDIPLQRLTVIAGPNASGKTSVLEGLHYLSQLTNKPPEQLFKGIRSVDYLHSGDAMSELELVVSSSEGDCFRLMSRKEDSGGNKNAQWSHYLSARSPFLDNSAQFTPWEDYGGPDRAVVTKEVRRRVRSAFRNAVFLRLDAGNLASPSAGDVERVEANGQGLPSVLAGLKLEDDDQFRSIVQQLREIVPSVRDVRVRKWKINRQETEVLRDNGVPWTRVRDVSVPGFALVFDTASGKDLPAYVMSEGTILALGLLTVLAGPSSPRLVLLDDVDRALHPKAQRTLVELIRQIQKEKQHLQVVATSHSPYLLECLDSSEVLLSSIDEQGSARFASLHEHPEYSKWADEMSPGEFWSMVGEDWITDARTGADP